ncbi:MAG: hypothetical protein IJZ79_01750 [Bacilli bacterium]|nr:hypothetical protein [Bacilli bacterium]
MFQNYSIHAVICKWSKQAAGDAVDRSKKAAFDIISNILVISLVNI